MIGWRRSLCCIRVSRWLSLLLSLLLGLLLGLFLSLLLSLLLGLLLGLLLSLLLGLILTLLLALLAIHVDDDCRWGSSPKNKTCELGLCDSLLISEQLRLKVEERTRSDELAILLDEIRVTDEQALVRKDDGGWISEDLSIARSLWWLGTKGKQDRAIDLPKRRIGVKLSNLRSTASGGLRSVAHTRDTGYIQSCGRRGRADGQRLSRVHHDENFLTSCAIVRLQLVDHVASVDVVGISLVNDVCDCNNDSVHIVPSCLSLWLA